MTKLALVFIVLGYVASGCGKAPELNIKIPATGHIVAASKVKPEPDKCGGTWQPACQAPVQPPLCMINDVPVYSGLCCSQPWKPCQE